MAIKLKTFRYNGMTIRNQPGFRLITAPLFLSFILSTVLLLTDCKKDSKKASTDGVTGSTGSTGSTGGTGGSPSSVTLNNMFGVNAYEWNFLGPANPGVINETNMAIIKSFSAVRHYMDWEKLEHVQGGYTFNPTYDGTWNYDAMYARCKQEGILVLADMKQSPDWLVATYPTSLQNGEDDPAPYGSNLTDPASYIAQAKAAFQYAARYGANTNVNRSLLSVFTTPQYNGAPVNTIQVGLGLIKYIECNNEEDRWWNGVQTQQTPEQYAANLSAFYDGNMGKLGNNVGVKTADPTMMVVIGGLSTDDPNYVSRIVAWCKTNRGTKADGSINLCFDIINYHADSNSGKGLGASTTAGVGVAPELSESAAIADSFVALAATITGAGTANGHPEVWITETGYDINPGSSQAAIAIGNKSILVTQADWELRSSLLFARHGLNRAFFYQLFDDTPNNPGVFATSGLAVDNVGRRPAADYFYQAKALVGGYSFVKTLNADPLVDQYTNGTKTMYAMMIPDQKGRTGTYTLTIANNNPLTVYTPQAGANAMASVQVTPVNNKAAINVTETPIFVITN
jgi:hypothetical protein